MKTQIDNQEIKYPLYWCKHCTIPLLEEVCPSCNSKARPISDRRPVSMTEREMLERTLQHPLPSFLFARHNLIYFGDETLLRLTVNNGELKIGREWFSKLDNSNPLIYSEQYRIDMWEYSLNANSIALSNLEKESIQFIQETANRYKNRHRFVSFSGGKDSALTAILVNKALGSTPLLFSDTTIEYPPTYEYIIKFAEYLGVKLYWQKPQQTFLELCDVLDPPSRIMRWCCTVCKSQPINSFYNSLDEKILNFDGIRRAESARRAQYPRVYQVPKYAREITARPILDWPTFAVWAYIEMNKVPSNPLYDLGFSRIGCMYCPSNRGYNEYLMQRHFPDLYGRWYEYLLGYAIREGKPNPKSYVSSGYWKMRNVRRERKYVAEELETCIAKKEYSYDFTTPITDGIIDFLKPLGKTTIFSTNGNVCFTVGGSNPFMISGVVGDTRIAITYDNKEGYDKLLKKRINKQIEKYLNCVRCGGCLGVCPVGAISVDQTKLMIDASKCIQCGNCTSTAYLQYACIALSYKGAKKAIKKEQ